MDTVFAHLGGIVALVVVGRIETLRDLLEVVPAIVNWLMLLIEHE